MIGIFHKHARVKRSCVLGAPGAQQETAIGIGGARPRARHLDGAVIGAVRVRIATRVIEDQGPVHEADAIDPALARRW